MPNENNIDETSLTLLRHQLGSIDLSDIEEKLEGEGERAQYAASISAVFPRLEKDIKRFLHEQLMFMATQSANWDGVLFARGTFNGMDLLLEHWRRAHVEHTEKIVNKETFDPNNPIGEIE